MQLPTRSAGWGGTSRVQSQQVPVPEAQDSRRGGEEGGERLVG